MRAADAERWIVELARVETCRDPEVVPEPSTGQPMHAKPKLAPGRRNDPRLDFVSKNAIVSRWLVRFVGDAERDQEQTAFDVDLVAEFVVEPGLLDLGLALVFAAHHRMLPLDLRLEG